MRCLIVDDSEASGRTLTRLLEHEGHETQWVTERDSAIRLAREWAPEVIVLDINVGSDSGIAIAKEFRRLPETKAARLVGFSGESQPQSALRDFDAFVLKTSNSAELLKAIEGK